MFIADAHCDTLYALTVGKKSPQELQVTAQALEAGQVGLQTYALFCGGEKDPGTPFSRAQAMLEAIPQLGVPLLRGKLPQEKPQNPHGVLSIEGAEVLEGSLDRLEYFAAQGVKMIALTWNYETQVGYPALSGSRRGLKPFGRELVARMGQLGLICDVSHLNDQGIEDVLALSALPTAASHSNLREVANVPRNLPRALAQEIIRGGGYIGLNFYSAFLAQGRPATLSDLLAHLDGLLELGGEKAVGFGSDFDGIDAWPQGLEGPACLPALADLIARQGYPGEVVAGVAGENLWRLYRRAQGD